MAALDFAMTRALGRKAISSNKRSANLAYHLEQAFAPDDEVTPQKAHEIGRRLAEEFTEGKYEFVIATHIDKGHIHNHIIINAVSFLDFRRLRTVPYRTAAQIRNISDRLCTEAELSVIESPQKAGVSYERYLQKAHRNPVRTHLRKRLNFILERATSYEQFLQYARDLGIEVYDKGKHIAYHLDGAGRNVRGNKLADTEKYLPEGIREQVEVNAEAQEAVREALRECVINAHSLDVLKERLEDRGIRVNLSHKGQATYFWGEDAVKVPEDVLGVSWTWTKLLEGKRDGLAFEERPMEITTVWDEKKTPEVSDEEEVPKTLVRLTANQIEASSKLGVIIRAKNYSGASVRLMIAHDDVVIGADGNISVALGANFDYYFDSSAHQKSARTDYIRGSELIKQLELENGVKPTRVLLCDKNIRTLGVKGITITLPEAGIGRLYIPAEYVMRDRMAGTVSVELYDNWQYSFVSEQDGRRRYMKGDELRQCLQLMEKEYGHTSSDEMRRRINYVERREKLGQVKSLADILAHYAQARRTGQADLRQMVKDVAAQRVTLEQQKIKIEKQRAGYRIVARALQTVRSHSNIPRMSALKKKLYEQKHAADIAAYQQAVDILDKAGVRSDVELTKVLELIKVKEKQVDILQKQIDECAAKEKQLEMMQQRADAIREEHRKDEKEYEQE